MVANAWHECKERRTWNAPTGSIDVPIRVHDRWMIMVANGDTDTEVPVRFCPWCGLELEWAHKQIPYHPEVQRSKYSHTGKVQRKR